MKIKLKPVDEQTLVERLRNRAMIRRNNTERKSVQNNEPDRISDLLEEAASKIESQDKIIGELDDIVDRLEQRLSVVMQVESRIGKSKVQEFFKDLVPKQTRQTFSSESEASMMHKNMRSDITNRYEHIESYSGTDQFTGEYAYEVFIDRLENMKYEFEFDNSDEPYVVTWYKLNDN